MTAVCLQPGSGVNMRTWTRPNEHEHERLFNPLDCNNYRRRIYAAYGAAEQDEEEVRIDDDEFSLATAGTQSVGEEDPGGNKTTNHVQSDLNLFCQRDQVRDGRSLRVPRVAAAIEAKKSKGCVGHTSNNSHTQCTTYTRVCHAADGCLFGMVIHGLSFRIYQITPGSAGNEITTWIPTSAKSEFSRQNNATFSFKYKDSYEKIKSKPTCGAWLVALTGIHLGTNGNLRQRIWYHSSSI
ncbi:hypothetical protein HD553DRAFT_316499 [Filobasidium floriforme]|uniref:uncharacterized protein n=1 Tax=Filobasidium floriforme TaxID=5210 RepID=UPI001E8D2458|nr:uncharacterized protein HD553DRAFT_316499 [Filobasidium floriforme]KAH8080856.1 hypothetical protein HD553DRAFT_316499 [Filobasidium floriforme]